MTSIRRTAYPRFTSPLTEQELEELYQPTEEELHFVRRNAKGDSPRLTLLLLLKCQQHLGYPPALELIPENIRHYLCRHLEVSTATALTAGAEKTLYRYRQLIRAYLEIKSYVQGGPAVVEAATREAAYTMSDPADLINVAVEQLIRQRYELPAFSTLDRQVNHIRQQVHEALCQQVAAHLNAAQRQGLDGLLEVQPGRTRTDFNRLKEPPGPATLQHLRRWEERLAWLAALPDARLCLKGMANTKIKQFAAQAQALEVGDLRDIQDAPQRYTLLLCLVYEAQVHTWDQLGTMFLKRMRRIHHQAHGQLRVLQDQYRDLTEQMVTALAEIAHHATETLADAAFGQQVRQVLAAHGGPEALADHYRLVSAYHQNNYLPLLWTYYRSHRAVLFRWLTRLVIRSATQDQTLLRALQFIQHHQTSRRAYLPADIALDFASARWQTLIRTSHEGQLVLKRRELETCVFSYLADGLRSGDLFVVGSEEYADYRTQLLSWAACQPRVDTYCEALGLPNTPHAFVQQLRERLLRAAQTLDASMPENSELTLDAEGNPHLRQAARQPLPPGVEALEAAIQERMPERELLDILKRVHYWVDYTRHFGPPSGSDPKLTDAVLRYILTVFGYGCNLGAAQTARHTRGACHPADPDAPQCPAYLHGGIGSRLARCHP